MITVSEEKISDYEMTAQIATQAFAPKQVVFSGERMRWLYERSFGQGTTILAVSDDGVKVGQIALVHQKVCSNGAPATATQLVDLFILEKYRSAPLVRRLYKEVERLCQTRNIRFILAIPNENAELLNARLLKLKPLLRMPFRAGIAFGRPRAAQLKYSGYLRSMTESEAVELLSSFDTASAGNGLHWDGNTLFGRMLDPTHDYAVHATEDLLLISSSRRTNGIAYVLFCGFLARSSATATSAGIQELVRAACKLWRHSLFVYAGINNSLPTLPGFALPSWVRPAKLVQLRDLDAQEPGVQFDRFQLIDSDFA